MSGMTSFLASRTGVVQAPKTLARGAVRAANKIAGGEKASEVAKSQSKQAPPKKSYGRSTPYDDFGGTYGQAGALPPLSRQINPDYDDEA